MGQAEMLADIEDVKKRQSIAEKWLQELRECVSVIKQSLEQFPMVQDEAGELEKVLEPLTGK